MTPGAEECLGRRARYFGPHCRLEPVGVVCSLPSRHQMFKVMSDGPGSTFERNESSHLGKSGYVLLFDGGPPEDVLVYDKMQPELSFSSPIKYELY